MTRPTNNKVNQRSGSFRALMMVVRNLAAADVVNVCSHLSPSRIYRETDLLQSPPFCLFSYRKSLISAILAISDICMHPRGQHTGAKILNLSENSHFENLIVHKIHKFKTSFLTKFTFSKSQF